MLSGMPRKICSAYGTCFIFDSGTLACPQQESGDTSSLKMFLSKSNMIQIIYTPYFPIER